MTSPRFSSFSCALACAALVLGCADEGRVSGGTVETENVYAILVDSLLPPWNHPTAYATVASLRLDGSNFPFARSSKDGHDISVEKPDGEPVPFEIHFWDSAAGRARLRVRLDTGLLAPRKARFLLKWGLDSGSKPDSVAVWNGISASQRQAITSLLVDDFEQGVNQCMLPGAGRWYGTASDSATVSQVGLVPADSGRSGTAIHISYTTTGSTAYSLVGVALGGSRSFRGLDSMVSWVRGSGKLSIAFDRLIEGHKAKAWAHYTLKPGWTRIALRPADFAAAKPSIGNNIGWDAVQDTITNITFLVAGGKDLWVDDIRLHGLEWDDFR